MNLPPAPKPSPMPPGFLQQNREPAVLATIIAAGSISTTVVLLRLVARRVCKASFGLDDLFVVFAVLFAWAISAGTIWSVKNDGAKHIWAITSNDMSALQRAGALINIVYVFWAVMAKLSILFFYRRVFPVSPVRVGSLILILLVTAWFIAFLFPLVFACRPAALQWDTNIKHGSCLDLAHLILATYISHVIIDGAILILPMPTIWNLKTSVGKKIGISAIFAGGAVDIVISGIRIYTLGYHGPDVFWTHAVGCIWTQVEVHLAIVCACLPTLLPLARWALLRVGITDNRSSPRVAYYRGERRPSLGRQPHPNVNINVNGDDPANPPRSMSIRHFWPGQLPTSLSRSRALSRTNRSSYHQMEGGSPSPGPRGADCSWADITAVAVCERPVSVRVADTDLEKAEPGGGTLLRPGEVCVKTNIDVYHEIVEP